VNDALAQSDRHGKARSDAPPGVVGHLSVTSMSSDVILEEFEVQ
jgi:hypothetical protein